MTDTETFALPIPHDPHELDAEGEGVREHLLRHHGWEETAPELSHTGEAYGRHQREHERVGKRLFFVAIRREFTEEVTVWAHDDHDARSEVWARTGSRTQAALLRRWNRSDRIERTELASQVRTPTAPDHLG